MVLRRTTVCTPFICPLLLPPTPGTPSDRRIFLSSSSDLLRSHLTPSHPPFEITMETFQRGGAAGTALNSGGSETDASFSATPRHCCLHPLL